MANIALKKQSKIISGISEKTFVQGSVSDIDGNFLIDNLESGEYILECSFIGYKTYSVTINLKADEEKYLTLKIVEETNMLGDVVISAGKFEQKIEEVTVSMDVIKPKLIKSKNPVVETKCVNEKGKKEVLISSHVF